MSDEVPVPADASKVEEVAAGDKPSAEEMTRCARQVLGCCRSHAARTTLGTVTLGSAMAVWLTTALVLLFVTLSLCQQGLLLRLVLPLRHPRGA